MKTSILKLLLISLLIISCKKTETEPKSTGADLKDPLPSMNDGAHKTAIIDFVEAVSRENDEKFVPVEDRIAVFDNDGTLWVEQPLPSQLYFNFYRIKELAKTQSELNNEQPYKAVIENDTVSMKKWGLNDIIKIIGKSDEIDDVTKFDTIVNSYLATAEHPVMHKKFTDLVYQPMLELINYLKRKEFTIYIVSGGSQEFMRPWAPRVYGIEKQNIIGTTFKTKVSDVGETETVAQTMDFDFLDDHEGKSENIRKFLGKKPIFIAGNSDGDLNMMEFSTTENPHPTFMMYVNHDDGEREFLYNDKVLSGALIKGKQVAEDKGWTIISMKNDWKTIFPTPSN